MDSLQDADLWFETMCTMKDGPSRLLLSGHDLGQPVDYKTIQTGLDFSEREKELFQSSELGASVLRELLRYGDVLNKVKVRIKQEIPVVESAQKWAAHL